MTANELLPAFKVDIGFVNSKYDQRLIAYLSNAQEQIKREGITLTDQIDDQQLVVMYAAWSWTKRKTGEGMPRMLRYALNNRLMQEKANG